MDPPPVFRLPSKDQQPLRTLSPERVNGIRQPSTLSTVTTLTSKTSDTESQYPPDISSTHSSPTRKAGLFADYNPSNGTPTKVSGFGLPQSPSLPDIHTLRSHVRTNSDVQGLVKRFEHLDVRDRDAESVERRKRHDAELRRAQIAREEAESDVKRLREEVRRMKKETEEGRERERRVAKRLEILMEDYASTKEAHASQSGIYEKELRRARKEAFKSSSAVVKLQEELKSTRNSLRITQSGFDLEKQKVERKEQEAFSAQYQLIAVQEELDKLQAILRTVEAEKEALKTSLKEEEVARIAAEGMIALPATQEDDDELTITSRCASPRKRVVSPLSDDKENVGAGPKKALQTKQLEEQLLREQMRREHAEEMTEFLTMECVFRCCKCRTASRAGHDLSLSLSSELAAAIDVLRCDMKSALTIPEILDEPETMQVDTGAASKSEIAEAEEVVRVEPETMAVEDVMETAEDQDRSMTIEAEEPEVQPAVEEEEPRAPHPTSVNPVDDAEHEEDVPQTITIIPLQPSDPETPSHPTQSTPFRHQASVRTVTTTTTIPMHFTPISKPHLLHHVEDAENIPPQLDGATDKPTFDRAAALAAIEYRRGRAKSIASGHMTPRKQMLEGVNVKERRDISAPALGGKTTVGGGSFAKGASSVGRSAGRQMGL